MSTTPNQPPEPDREPEPQDAYPWQSPQQDQAPYSGAQYGGAGQQYGEPQYSNPQYGGTGQYSNPQYGNPQYGNAQYGGSPGQYQAAPPPPPYGMGQQPYGYPSSVLPPGMPPLAGWWARVWAWLLDNFFVGAVFGLVAGITDSRAVEIIGGIAALAWSIYNAIRAGSTGQSFGKRTAGIRLARLVDGQPVGGGLGFVRWLLDMVFWWACVLPGLLNYVWPLWDVRSQTWCDKIAKSVVVRAG